MTTQFTSYGVECHLVHYRHERIVLLKITQRKGGQNLQDEYFNFVFAYILEFTFGGLKVTKAIFNF